MDNYKIVPYLQEHGSSMIASGLNDKLMDLDASYEENRIDLTVSGMAFTLLCNSEPIVSGGIYPL